MTMPNKLERMSGREWAIFAAHYIPPILGTVGVITVIGSICSGNWNVVDMAIRHNNIGDLFWNPLSGIAETAAGAWSWRRVDRMNRKQSIASRSSK